MEQQLDSYRKKHRFNHPGIDAPSPLAKSLCKRREVFDTGFQYLMDARVMSVRHLDHPDQKGIIRPLPADRCPTNHYLHNVQTHRLSLTRSVPALSSTTSMKRPSPAPAPAGRVQMGRGKPPPDMPRPCPGSNSPAPSRSILAPTPTLAYQQLRSPSVAASDYQSTLYQAISSPGLSFNQIHHQPRDELRNVRQVHSSANLRQPSQPPIGSGCPSHHQEQMNVNEPRHFKQSPHYREDREDFGNYDQHRYYQEQQEFEHNRHTCTTPTQQQFNKTFEALNSLNAQMRGPVSPYVTQEYHTQDTTQAPESDPMDISDDLNGMAGVAHPEQVTPAANRRPSNTEQPIDQGTPVNTRPSGSGLDLVPIETEILGANTTLRASEVTIQEDFNAAGNLTKLDEDSFLGSCN
ncbi:hypothetical protein BJ508DRAFT_335773 [Ascobolus immersus RN42]|uniref:Uncharacterized protein n=1 Tax=Ascobolus immersus RN42 TaxID=1160509 RepID=A0A3N4HPW8_ASCIM|nr:hypothetical protein BJ508DRAFT_335773 [Ascobolus immersus RN42]